MRYAAVPTGRSSAAAGDFGIPAPRAAGDASYPRQMKLGLPFGQSQFYCLSKFSILSRLQQCFDSGTDLPHLPEQCHDVVDYRHENALGFLAVRALFDEITALLSMLVKNGKFTSFIFLDRLNPMTRPTSS